MKVKGRVDLNDENNENDRRHQYAPLPELSENERREAAIEQQQKILRQVAASRKQVSGTMAVNSDLKENHVHTDRQISNEARPQIATKKLPYQKQTSEEYDMVSAEMDLIFLFGLRLLYLIFSYFVCKFRRK